MSTPRPVVSDVVTFEVFFGAERLVVTLFSRVTKGEETETRFEQGPYLDVTLLPSPTILRCSWGQRKRSP